MIVNKKLDSIIKDEVCKFYGVTEQEILEWAEFKSYRYVKYENDFYSPNGKIGSISANMDNTIPATEIIRDPEANTHLTLEERIEFHTSDKDLYPLDSSANQSKGDTLMSDWHDSERDGKETEERFDIDEDKLRQMYKETREECEKDFIREEYKKVKNGRIPSVICDYLYYEISVLSDSYEEWFGSYGFQEIVYYCRQLIESDEKIMNDILEIESKCILRLNSPELIKNLLLSIKNLHDDIFVLQHRLNEYELLEQERNDIKDFADILKRASDGELQAQIEISERYATGRSTEKNETEAFEWRKKAAEQDDAESQALIADFYKRGYGTAKSKEEAFNWYIKSAENDNEKSMYFVGEFYYQGQGIRQDFEKAFYWFMRSAEKGYRSGKYWVGKCYYEGIGVKSDHDLAFKWIEEAAKAENQPAKKFLNVHHDEYKEYRSRMK